jgi:hypothetical protein
MAFTAEQKIKRNKASDKWKKLNPEKVKAQQLKIKYWPHLTAADAYDNFLDMMNAQGGRCAACGVHQNDLTKSLYVDHDHATGSIKGLLCNPCNFSEGQLLSSKNARGLAAYMERLGK